MLELGSSGSVRGVSSNGHPYRDPGPVPDVRLGALNRGAWIAWIFRNCFIPLASIILSSDASDAHKGDC